jgi:hypothetical protein
VGSRARLDAAEMRNIFSLYRDSKCRPALLADVSRMGSSREPKCGSQFSQNLTHIHPDTAKLLWQSVKVPPEAPTASAES